MNEELDLNLNFLETEINSIEIRDYGTSESDLFFDKNCFEIPNTDDNWNMFEAKDEVLFDLSLVNDNPIYCSPDEASTFFLTMLYWITLLEN